MAQDQERAEEKSLWLITWWRDLLDVSGIISFVYITIYHLIYTYCMYLYVVVTIEYTLYYSI